MATIHLNDDSSIHDSCNCFGSRLVHQTRNNPLTLHTRKNLQTNERDKNTHKHTPTHTHAHTHTHTHTPTEHPNSNAHNWKNGLSQVSLCITLRCWPGEDQKTPYGGGTTNVNICVSCGPANTKRPMREPSKR